MPAPAERVHRQFRRVGQLHEEQFFARHVGDAGGVVADGESVEGIDDQAECRMRRLLHDPPGVPPAVDVAAPGQRLVADAQAARRRAVRHRGEVGRGARVVRRRQRRGVAAHQQQIGAERLHHVELALGAIHVAGALHLRHRLEIAERLVDLDGQPEFLADRAHVGGGAVEREQIGLEHLDAVEAGGGGRLQLLRQRAAERDGRDRLAQRAGGLRHGWTLALEVARTAVRRASLPPDAAGQARASGSDRSRAPSSPKRRPPGRSPR